MHNKLQNTHIIAKMNNNNCTKHEQYYDDYDGNNEIQEILDQIIIRNII